MDRTRPCSWKERVELVEFSVYRFDGHSLDPVLLVKLSTESPTGIRLVTTCFSTPDALSVYGLDEDLWIRRGFMMFKGPIREIYRQDLQGRCERDPTPPSPAMDASPWIHHCV